MPVSSPRAAAKVRYISGVPIDHAYEAQHRRELAEKINQLVARENAVVFDDYLFSGLSLGKGATPPDLANLRDDLYLNAFAGTGGTTEEGFFTLHIRHGIKAGSTPTFHVHWTHNQADPSGNVKWHIDYSAAKGYGVSTYSAATTITTTQTAAAQYTHHITDDDDMPITPITEIEPDSVLVCRIYRDPAADTFEADAFLIHIDMHYERDKRGTPERNRPFTGY